jgi:hypothetical protein
MTSIRACALVGVLVAAGWLGCNERPDPTPCPTSTCADLPPQVLRYHGEPSSLICGERWSNDREGVECEGGWLALADLEPLHSLKQLHLIDVRLLPGDATSIPSLKGVSLVRTKLGADTLATLASNLRYISLSEVPMPAAALARFEQLTVVDYSRVPPPDVRELARIPKLERVHLSFLQCPEPDCGIALVAELRALRPDLEIVLNGRSIHKPGGFERF